MTESYGKQLHTEVEGEEVASVCPVCGTTLDDFYRTGLLGCADCYKQFRAEILPTVKKVHGKISHEGAQPILHSSDDYSDVLFEEKLHAQIELAMREGRFDEVKQLQAEYRAWKNNHTRKF